MLSWVPGVTVDTLDGSARAAEAGSLVGRWHRATADLEHDFAFSRPGAHDTEAHMATLRRALDEHRGHRLHGEVEALAEQILGGWEAWTGQLEGRPRIAHGDLKISNLRFDAQGRGLCLLDFDTLSKLPLDIELGDAARSWCNPLGEDVAQAQFDVELFEAGFGAYAAANPLQPEEREALPRGVQRICLELAARFAADALAESYFGWRPEVAPTRGDHNLLRARGQASLAASVAGLLGRMERALLA